MSHYENLFSVPVFGSVADPDPGSIAFCPWIQIRDVKILIRDGNKSGSNIRDSG
jgi:hypothetical protein